MSGYEEIAGWSFDNFDVMLYDSYDDWLIDVKQDFLENGRDLDAIFDDSDFNNLEADWNDIKRTGEIRSDLEREEFTSQPVPEIEKPEGVEPIPLFEEEEERPEEFEEEEEEQGILSKIGNFFRGLFK